MAPIINPNRPPSPHSSAAARQYGPSYSSDSEDLNELDPLAGAEEAKLGIDPTGPKGHTLPILRSKLKGTYTRKSTFARLVLRPLLRLGRLCFALLLAIGGGILFVCFTHRIWGMRGLRPPDGLSEPYYPTPVGGHVADWAASYMKAAVVVNEMTLAEKVNITTGTGWMMGMCVGNTGPVDRLSFPSLCLQDGPLGLRYADNITAFPAGIHVGATWDIDLMYYRGRVLGMESRTKGVNVLLGPSVGPIGRHPAGGRNWEGFGADPVLQGIAAARTIKGIQEEGVIATIKHYVANEQEHYRQAWEWGTSNAISATIDDRTMHELYGWPFAEAVRAGVGSVMCSYNMVNMSYACQNSKLLNGILKDELLFQGFVQSDWLAQRSGVASALAGLDMSMPGDGLYWADGKSLWGKELTLAALNGSLPMERLNDMAMRIVATWYKMYQDDIQAWPILEGGPSFSSWTWEEEGLLHPGSNDKTRGRVNKFINAQGEGDQFHGSLALEIAADGIVLVKNDDNVLPFSANMADLPKKGDKYKISIVGESAFTNPNGPNACEDRGCNVGALGMGWGSGTAEYPYFIEPFTAIKKLFYDPAVEINKVSSNRPGQNAGIASSDLCVVFVSSDAGEGYLSWKDTNGDRNNLRLDNKGDELVKNVAGQCGGGNSPVVVVLNSVGPVIVEEWIDISNVKSLLFAGLPSQESGNAIAHVLFGILNPSGHLPYTVGKHEKDYGPGSEIMYSKNEPIPNQNYTEGLYIDYRWFDKQDIEPRYPFGHGISYGTKFTIAELHVDLRRKKELLPKPPTYILSPPDVDNSMPKAKDALLPKGFKRLKKYVYPYIDSLSEIKEGKYPYPEGYSDQQREEIPASGGAQGGNRALYETFAMVWFEVHNDGDRDGKAVAQVYVSYPEGYTDEETGEPIDFPVKQLRNFQKISVGKNGIQKVAIQLTRKDLSYWCTRRQNWVLPTTGTFSIHVGFSAGDIRATAEL